MPKFKLHVRVGIVISALSLLFIFTFTSIQLNNHLERLNAYNKYRARLSTIIVKTTLEMLAKDMQGEDELSGIFGAAIDSFSSEGVVEKISVLSMDGKVVTTNDPIVREFGEAAQDIETYSNLSRATGQESWFYSSINENTKIIDIYIPLATGAVKKYIAKLSFSIGNISQAIVDTMVPIVLTSIAVILGNLVLGFILLKTVVWPIEVLNSATKEIASGNLDMKVSINTNDEIQELGETFNEMTIALKKMKEKAENANPLTKLPGNNVIRDEVESRIARGSKFVAVHVDLDNFKAYNDRYGIAKGDEVIKFTSKVLEGAIRSKGNTGDFLGHEGGDDFFIITTPDKVDLVTGEIISEFDSKVRTFYSEEDLKTGFIMEKDRKGEIVKFPIMSISMAGVTNQVRPISSYGELTNIAVSIKVKAKQVKKSNFILDRRTV
ncbi:MAG: diguanylate cyclase [Candidatus Omnitrophota bacterium]|nr:diguanylate cyclase [Candidatus Omnitrophota bacterium]